jgi:hypothetical protein
MASPLEDPSLQYVFGRAFLVALEGGNLAAATAFARAFLERHAEWSGGGLSAMQGAA